MTISLMLKNSHPVVIWGYLVLMFFLRYLIIAGAAWLIVWKWFPQRFAKYRIQTNVPETRHIKREFFYSILTMFVFASIGTCVIFAAWHDWTQVYARFDKHGIPYFLFSIFLALVIHDAFFYWAHRLMHHPLLYKKVHLVHHLSTNPSPWAAFSFHPYESVIEALIIPIIVVLFPIHIYAIIIFLIIMTALNVVGHLGYEFYPEGFVIHPLLRLSNTSTHHNMHHKFVHCNYGLYFNWWDRWMKTNHPEYANKFLELKRNSVRI